MKERVQSISTRAVYAGTSTFESRSRPAVTPIYTAAVFSFESLAQLDEVWEGRAPGYIYSRMRNPTVEALEAAVNDLEGGNGAVAFASGMAASTLSVLSCVSQGDHVVAAKVLYGGTYTFFRDELPKRGVSASFVDIMDLDEVRSAVRPGTRVLYCETISNPLMVVADLSALADIAHGAGAVLMVDNTFASPVLCRPMEFGADVVIHSSTKYLNGHSDVIGGVSVASSEKLAGDIRSLATLYGATPSPFDAYLTLRGLRTLDLRVKKASDNAMRLARFLKGHPRVREVYYPGLEGSSQRLLAERYLSGGFGGMLSFEVEGGLEGASRFIDSLQMVELAPSLADVSTTISHPGKTSHRSVPEADREALGVRDGLIRVSVGVEEYDDIQNDFAQALERV